MADKKPLSDKKLRRMLKKQKLKEEKKNSDKSSLDGKLPKEWQTPPKNLKGKEKGLWFRDRQRLLRQMKENESMMNVGKKLTKKERKALRVQLADQQKSSEAISQCFRIAFDPTREQMIEEYLNFVADEPPSFLIPQHEYHKKLKRKYPSDPNDNYQDSFATAEEDSPPEIFDIEENLQKTKRLYESFPEDITNGTSCISNASIQSFLNRDKTDHVNVTDDRYPHYNDSHSSRPERDSLYGTNNESFLDSVDKYKHLEDTPFKQSFLNLLSNSIQSNLQKALKHNAMTRNKMLDKEYYHAFRAKQRTPKYRHMLSARNRLPAFKMRHEILQIIDRNQIVLLSGETGCGKTTQVAQFILDEAIESQNGSICNILCTQPRRISAVSVAQRVADERAETVGRESIGYQIRLEKKIGRPRGAILYCTTGILLQYMQSDPALKKYSHIILDEIHERDTLCDFVLTILRDVAAKRTDLKIILMSATLNAEQFSKYFHDCPSMNIPGYTYPVEELYLEDVLALTKFKFGNIKKKQENTEDLESFKRFVLPYVRTLKNKYPEFVLEGLSNPNSEKINADLIVELIRYISFNLGPGAILVFVPGWEDINSIVRKINESDQVFVPSKFLVLPLHSMLPTANQQTVFDRPPQGQRKIVVATNIAETSITIDDVVYVIDCGKIKIKNYDVVNNISTLKPEFVSLANARQRRGRAGRVQNGVCYHLFSRGREKALDDYPLPEMLRTRLEETILSIKLLQLGNAAPFLEKVMDPPNPKAVSLALELLRQLNALDENENLTPLGFHLAKLPLDPQIGKMLLMGVTMSCLNPILSIAATLSFKDPFYLPLGEERKLKDRKLELDKGHKSDHLIMAEVIDRWEEQEKRGQGRHFCAENYLTRGTLYQLRDQKLLFAQYLCEMGFLYNTNYKHPNLNMNSDNIAMVKAVICSGLYPNVAIIKRKINTGGGSRCILLLKTSEDGKVSLHPKSVNTLQQSEFESNFLVYHEKLRSSCIFIYDSTMVSALPLLVFCYDFYLTYEKRKVIIQLNKDLQFVCNKKTANLIVELKLRLSWLLEYKLSHPGQVTWNDKSSDILLLKTLTSLFTTENDVLMGAKCDSSD